MKSLLLTRAQIFEKAGMKDKSCEILHELGSVRKKSPWQPQLPKANILKYQNLVKKYLKIDFFE